MPDGPKDVEVERPFARIISYHPGMIDMRGGISAYSSTYASRLTTWRAGRCHKMTIVKKESINNMTTILRGGGQVNLRHTFRYQGLTRNNSVGADVISDAVMGEHLSKENAAVCSQMVL